MPVPLIADIVAFLNIDTSKPDRIKRVISCELKKKERNKTKQNKQTKTKTKTKN